MSKELEEPKPPLCPDCDCECELWDQDDGDPDDMWRWTCTECWTAWSPDILPVPQEGSDYEQ